MVDARPIGKARPSPRPQEFHVHFIQTPQAPVPAGHYSQAVVHNGLVYVAGQLPHDPAAPGADPGDAEAQTEQTLRNVQAVLEAAGSGLHRILQATVYVTDVGLWGDVNRAYARIMGEHRPARAVVPVKELHHGYLVEIQVIAATGEGS
jgi:2-iminobutanoate/2-iminopropanoate deaminase